MSNFAPPISRDGFVYHGQLFADVGNLNRHPRASEAELNALLRPTKSAKDTSKKDQVGHWYIAQLKHYGLPQTKDKNAAKIRLLDALNTKKLKVPPDVKKLEAALKKEYETANRKAKADLKRQSPSAGPDTTTPPRKRKRERNEDETAAAASTPAASKKAAKAPARRDRENPSSTKTKKSSGAAATPQRKTDETQSSNKDVHEGKKGTYYLTVPLIASQWPALAARSKALKMLLCPDGEKLWGSYSFGPFSGILLFSENHRGDTFRFAWRGTDTNNPEQVKFTTGLGDLRFLNLRRVEGSFYNLYGYRCTFEGRLQGGVRQCPRDALSFQHEWDDYGRNNGWVGWPPVTVPDGERLPAGQFARNSALAALKPAEPRYLPVDVTQDKVVESSRKDHSKSKKTDKQKVNSLQQESQESRTSNIIRRTSYIKGEDDYNNDSPFASGPAYSPVDIGQITGIYEIQCPAIEDNFLDTQNKLRLLLCRDPRSPRTWGGFVWGPFSGVMQMNPGPTDYSSISVTFGWRARDVETGSIRFGRGCNGSIEFLEPGVIQGRMFGLYGNVVEFWGQRRPGPRNCGHAPNKFEDEWNSFPSEVYGGRRGSESDGELYDRNGNLNPRGRFSGLLERALRD